MSGPRLSIIPAGALADVIAGLMKDSDLRVLNAIGTYTDKKGWTHPTRHEVFADRCGFRRQRVVEAITTLEWLGWVESKAGRADRPKAYRVRLDPGDDREPGVAPERSRSDFMHFRKKGEWPEDAVEEDPQPQLTLSANADNALSANDDSAESANADKPCPDCADNPCPPCADSSYDSLSESSSEKSADARVKTPPGGVPEERAQGSAGGGGGEAGAPPSARWREVRAQAKARFGVIRYGSDISRLTAEGAAVIAVSRFDVEPVARAYGPFFREFGFEAVRSADGAEVRL